MLIQPHAKSDQFFLSFVDSEVGHLDIDIPSRGTFDLPIMSRDQMYPLLSVGLGHRDPFLAGSGTTEISCTTLLAWAPTPFGTEGWTQVIRVSNASRSTQKITVQWILHSGTALSLGTGRFDPELPRKHSEEIPAGLVRIHVPDAWTYSRGEGTKIGLLDTGIDGRHQDLRGSLGDWQSFIGDNDPSDQNGHGTWNAGIVAGVENGFGIIGVAPKCRLYSAKVLDAAGSGSLEGVLDALQWCEDNQLDVVFMPFGSGNPNRRFEEACDRLAGKGVLLVSGPATNQGDPVYPGSFASVLSTAPVASIRRQGAELYASTTIMNSTLPGDRYGEPSLGMGAAGTMIAGVAGLVKSIDPTTSPAEVRRRLLATADDIPGYPNAKAVNALRAAQG